MSELASVEKLRNYTFYDKGEKYSAYIDADKLANEIEREVLERFIELPVGDDGMPIHVGDCCEMNGERFEVRQLRTDGDYWWAIDRLGRSLMTTFCRHVKPSTIEDVLRQFIIDAKEYHTTDSFNDLVKEYAVELREMMEVDE